MKADKVVASRTKRPGDMLWNKWTGREGGCNGRWCLVASWELYDPVLGLRFIDMQHFIKTQQQQIEIKLIMH